MTPADRSAPTGETEIDRAELDALRRALDRYDAADDWVMRDWDDAALREYYHAAHYLNRRLRALADKLLQAARRDVDYRERKSGTTHSPECWRWHHGCAIAKIQEVHYGGA